MKFAVQKGCCWYGSVEADTAEEALDLVAASIDRSQYTDDDGSPIEVKIRVQGADGAHASRLVEV